MRPWANAFGELTWRKNHFRLQFGDEFWRLVPVDETNAYLQRLREKLAGSPPHVAIACAEHIGGRDCRLKIECYPLKEFADRPMCIGVKEQTGQTGFSEQLCKELLASSQPGFLDFFVLSSAFVDDYLHAFRKKYPDMVAVAMVGKQRDARSLLIVSAVPGDGGKEQVLLEGMEPLCNPEPSPRDITLHRVRATLGPWQSATPVSSIPFTKIGAAVHHGDYLLTWDRYCTTEENMVLEKIAQIACHRVAPDMLAQDDEGLCMLTSRSEEWAKIFAALDGNAVQFSNTEPPHLRGWDAKAPLAEKMAKLRQSLLAEEIPKDDCFVKREAEAVLQSDGTLHVGVPWDKGLAGEYPYLSLSVSGMIEPLRRRRRAMNALKDPEFSCGISYLPRILDKDDTLEYCGGPQVSPARMDDDTKSRIFSPNGPNENQEDAVNMALGTPDICLIQGPPGTGKTTVIKAIVESIFKNWKDYSHKPPIVGVFAQQHVAVSNVTNHLRVFGIPAVKVGSSSEEKKGSLDYGQSGALAPWSNLLDSWKSQLLAQHPDWEKSFANSGFEACFKDYLSSPSRRHAQKLLSSILDAPDGEIPREIKDRCRRMLERRERPEARARAAAASSLLPAIRALRTTRRAYEDDGEERIECLLNILTDRNVCAKGWIEALQAIRGSSFSGDLLRKVADIKERMLAHFLPDEPYQRQKYDEEVLQLAKDVRSAAEKMNPEAWRRNILADFVAASETNGFSLLEGWKDYTCVFGATVQQCAAQELNRALGKRAENDATSVAFDTVIIDEAARCSPPDLLIPMVRAARRIVLVGDHRQLPHMVDDRIAECLEQGREMAEIENDAAIRHLKQSLFGYLMQRLREQEERDHIRRFIMLNVQYRMHPALGALVNRNFYETPERNESLRSGLDAGNSCFRHRLGFNGKHEPMAWINVPEGQMLRCGTSWCRTSEVKAIAKYLRVWMKAEPLLTFQVITYYSAQSRQILKTLKNMFDGKLPERLEVGTVDAFQGKEADIVLLSLVRTRRHLYRKADVRSLYGHLTMKERLCVSMSRQKRALIMVGDAEFFHHSGDLDTAPVRALADFYLECRERDTFLPPSPCDD